MNYWCKEIKCNNKICYITYKYGKGRCSSCSKKKKNLSNKSIEKLSIASKGLNNPSYIDGRCSKIYYCKENECNNKITIHTALRGGGRCSSCAGKNSCKYVDV